MKPNEYSFYISSKGLGKWITQQIMSVWLSA